MFMSRKNIIYNSLKMIILSGLLYAVPSGVQATHIVGSDMTFTCNAKEWFEINLTVRRDCINGDEEAVFDDPAFVGIYDAYGTPLNWLGSLGLVKMDLVSVETIPVDQLGACAGDAQNICVSEARYVGQVFLPFREKGYILGYQRCCRNVTLSNIVNPLETGTTSFVCITEESLNTCNSSPVFGDWPEVVICAGEPLVFDASANDANGDSLVYKLYTPHSGASLATPQPIPPAGPPYDTVVYAPGFSLNNQLGSGTPLSIDPATGVLTATPGAIGQFLVGILVEEWRDGQEISKTRRNFEYNVVICDATGEISFESIDLDCDDNTIEFTNTSTDLERSFRWNFNYPGDDPSFISTEVSPEFTFPGPGTYQVQLTSEGGQPTCNTEFIKTVRIIDSQLTASCEVDLGECEDDERSVTITATSTEGDPDFQVQSNTITVTVNGTSMTYEDVASFELACTDTATVTIVTRSTSGCEAMTTKSVPSRDNPGGGGSGKSIEFISNPIPLCPGDSTRIVANPNPLCTYVWSPMEGLNLDVPSDPIAFPSQTTLYYVTVSNGDTSIMDSVLVEVIDRRLDLSIVNNTGICDDFATLSVTSNERDTEGVTFEWSTDPDFTTIVATGSDVQIPIVGTTFYVRGVGPGICGSNVPIVTVPAGVHGITASFSPIDGCTSNTGTVSLVSQDPSLTFTTQWEPTPNITSSLDQADIEIIALDGQTSIPLTYSVTDTNGCTKTETINVPVLDSGGLLNLGILNDGSSCGDTAHLTAIINSQVSGNLVLDWATDPNFTNVVASGQSVQIPISGPTTIYLRGGGQEFCGSNVPSISLNEDATGFSADFTPINTCANNNGTVSIVSDDPNQVFTVVWEQSDNITSALDAATVDIVALEGETEVTLSYTVTSSDGCSGSASVTIPVVEDFTVSVSGGSSVCVTSTAFYASSNLDPQFVSYEWSLDPEFSSIISISDTLEVDLPDGTEVYLRGRSDAGCISNVASGTISTEAGQVGVTAPRRICIGDTAMVSLDLPPSDNLMVTWNASTSIISSLDGPEVTIIGTASTGSIVLGYTATNEDSCVITGEVIIPNSTIINPNPDPQIQCGTHGVQFVIDPIYEDGDVFWDFGNLDGQDITSTEANPLIDFGMAGVFNGTLSSTMETCNFDPFQVFFEVPVILEISSDQDEEQLICEGDSMVTIGATSNGSVIVWTDQDGNLLTTGDSVTVDVRDISGVTGTVTDAFGCTATLDFTTGFYEFDINLDIPVEPVCGGKEISVSVSNNNSDSLIYLWVSESGIASGANTATPEIIPGQAEDLVLIVTNEIGCTMEFPAPVFGGGEFSVSIEADPDRPIVRGESVTLTVVTDAVNPTFMWSNGETTQSITVSPEETTTYTVVCVDENGCPVEASHTVEVIDPPCDESGIFIPDAFSPNNDTSNDLLFVRGNGIESLDFQVLDRWGKEVFRTTDQNEGWNGRHRQNGKELSPDVYAYCVKVTCFDGTEFIKAGNVSLLR